MRLDTLAIGLVAFAIYVVYRTEEIVRRLQDIDTELEEEEPDIDEVE